MTKLHRVKFTDTILHNKQQYKCNWYLTHKARANELLATEMHGRKLVLVFFFSDNKKYLFEAVKKQV